MSQKRVIVTSERPDDHEDQLQDALDKQAAITAGTTGISVANYVTASTAAQVAQTAVGTRAPGSAKARDDAFQAMYIQEELVMAELQKKVDLLPGTIDAKIALALSNGFQVQDFGTINKQDFVVVDGPATGSVKLVALAGRDTFHEWGSSTDETTDFADITAWDYIESSFQASKNVGGFIPAKRMKFRHRRFTRKGPGPWHYFELIIR